MQSALALDTFGLAAPNPSVEEAKKALIFLETLFLGIYEKGGANRGPEVEMFQRSTGGSVGDSWCMESQQWFVRRICAVYRVEMRMFKSASCIQVWKNTPAEFRITKPEVCSIVIWDDEDGTGHTGLVIYVYPDGRFVTIEGNAHGSEGDGFYRLVHSMDGTRKIAGFIRPFG